MLLMRTLCHIMEQLWNQTGKSVDFFFFGLSLFLLIYVFLLIKTINMFSVGISPPQTLLPNFLVFFLFCYYY